MPKHYAYKNPNTKEIIEISDSKEKNFHAYFQNIENKNSSYWKRGYLSSFYTLDIMTFFS